MKRRTMSRMRINDEVTRCELFQFGEKKCVKHHFCVYLRRVPAMEHHHFNTQIIKKLAIFRRVFKHEKYGPYGDRTDE